MKTNKTNNFNKGLLCGIDKIIETLWIVRQDINSHTHDLNDIDTALQDNMSVNKGCEHTVRVLNHCFGKTWSDTCSSIQDLSECLLMVNKMKEELLKLNGEKEKRTKIKPTKKQLKKYPNCKEVIYQNKYGKIYQYITKDNDRITICSHR